MFGCKCSIVGINCCLPNYHQRFQKQRSFDEREKLWVPFIIRIILGSCLHWFPASSSCLSVENRTQVCINRLGKSTSFKWQKSLIGKYKGKFNIRLARAIIPSETSIELSCDFNTPMIKLPTIFLNEFVIGDYVFFSARPTPSLLEGKKRRWKATRERFR